jgi:hypothetical protein
MTARVRDGEGFHESSRQQVSIHEPVLGTVLELRIGLLRDSSIATDGCSTAMEAASAVDTAEVVEAGGAR